MKLYADNLPIVSKELRQSELRATEDLTRPNLNYFYELLLLNSTVAKDFIQSYLPLISIVPVEDNYKKYSQFMSDQNKFVVENVVEYTNNAAIIREENIDEFLKLSKNLSAEMMENIYVLVEESLKFRLGWSEPYVEIFRANFAIYEVVYKKISKANNVVSNNVRRELDLYANKLVSVQFEKSLSGTQQLIHKNDLDYAAESEGGSLD